VLLLYCLEKLGAIERLLQHKEALGDGSRSASGWRQPKGVHTTSAARGTRFAMQEALARNQFWHWKQARESVGPIKAL
jgi:hypothetical protein